MGIERFLASRYFWGNRKGTGFVSFIKSMTIAGVAIGSAGLLIALSIVHGFKETIQTKVVDFAPHITLQSFSNQPIYRADTLVQFINGMDGVTSAQAIISSEVMIQYQDQVVGAILKGVPTGYNESSLTGYSSGTSDSFTTSNNGEDKGLAYPLITLGDGIAQRLGVTLGSRIIIFSAKPSNNDLLNTPEIQQYQVADIYNTGIEFFDDMYAIAPIQAVRGLIDLSSPMAQQIEIRIEDPSLSKIVESEQLLDTFISFPFYTETIQDRYGNLFAWVELQENIIPLVIAVMILVAAFNLIGAILMMVLERTKDIGVLKALGATQKHITKVFLVEGLWVATLGLIIGIAISASFMYVQHEFQIIRLSEENYYMSAAPISPKAVDFLWVSIITFILCALASWIPAHIGAKLNPLKAIKLGAYS